MKTFYNHEFYTAIMDEDLGRIKELTKKHGSNFSILVKDTAHGNLRKVKLKKKKSFTAFNKCHMVRKSVNFSLKRRL